VPGTGVRTRSPWVASLLVVLALAAVYATPAGLANATPAPSRGNAGAEDKRVDVILRLEPRRSGIQRLARSVSDPASAKYGDYSDPRAVGTRFGASRGTRERVSTFLARRGVDSEVDVTRSFTHASPDAKTARELFGSPKQGAGKIPRGLVGDVRVVLQEAADPGDRLRPARSSRPRQGQLAPPHTRTGTPAGCEQGRNATFQPDGAPLAGPAFTPNQIQTAYGAAALHAQGIDGAGVRAAILGAGGFGRAELQRFGACFDIDPPPTRLVEVGTDDAGSTTFETALDLQMLALMAPGLERLDVYAVASGFLPVDFAAMLDPRNAPGGELPHLISVSQGECESDLGRAHVALTERVLAAAAASGITIATGAGDSGSYCSSGQVGFYPGSSRWVTSVGGTSLELTDANAIAAETVWNNLSLGLPAAGGGGISSYLKAPPYQAGLDTQGSRGYPDVAAFADGFPSIAIYCPADAQGNCVDSSAANPFQALGNGTSAATPLFTGALALADQRRLDAGAPPIGFANPLLYGLGSAGSGALRDIVEGTNDIGRGCCNAAPGFDLASGWGAPDAPALAAAALVGGR